MVATRVEALENELQEIKKAHEKEKEAHTTTKQEVVDLRIKLRELKRMHKATENGMQFWKLKAQLEGHAESNGKKVFTDDKELRAILPDPPVHPPERYKARSLPLSLDSSGPTPPNADPDDTLGDRSKGVEDHTKKRTFDEMNSGKSNDTSLASKKPSGRRVVVCIRCYQRKLRCDPGEPCQECATVNRRCKRAKCDDYETGTCRRASCLRAHRKDEEVYNDLVRAKHVPRDDPSKAMIPKAKKQRKDDDDENDGGSGNPRNGGTGIGIPLLT